MSHHYSLGIFYYFHDASACLIRDGQIIAMAEEERFNRKKHSFEFPLNAINYCLDTAGIKMSDVNVIGYGFRPMKYLINQILHAIFRLPTSLNLFKPGASYMPFGRKIMGLLFVRRTLVKHFGKFKASVKYIDHHLAHANSTFYPSGFEDAAIFVADGFAETSATSFFVGGKNGLTKIHEIPLPASLGVFYGTITQFLGFRPHSDEYKVMGLAAYGKNTYAEQISQILAPGKDALDFKMDESFIDFYSHGLNRWYSQKMIDLLGPARQYTDSYEQRHYDIARSAQTVLENTVIEILKRFRKITGQKKLCLAGGVAQNVLMNRRILDECGFDEVYVPPVAYDGGISLGSAIGATQKLGVPIGRTNKLVNAGFGPDFSDETCLKSIEAQGLTFKNISSDYSELVSVLEAGGVVGVFDGRMEVGPRALGRRSILADPRDRKMVDILNARIKRREFFRPFAPAIPLEDCPEFFDLEGESYFMTTVAHVKKPELIPAVTHNDGTARVQTVTMESNHNFYKLLKAFGKKTGVPV
ncbi:MAG: hypothetical protein NT027_00140, partial [Proteobacteria bacterium]|nr:hypothetical protein [Pseudomonadota bacterium]